MASQRDKQQFQRDVEAKDEEIEHVKVEYQRKVSKVFCTGVSSRNVRLFGLIF